MGRTTAFGRESPMDVHILVVDDEPEIAELVGVYLRSEGFVIHLSLIHI